MKEKKPLKKALHGEQPVDFRIEGTETVEVAKQSLLIFADNLRRTAEHLEVNHGEPLAEWQAQCLKMALAHTIEDHTMAMTEVLRNGHEGYDFPETALQEYHIAIELAYNLSKVES